LIEIGIGDVNEAVDEDEYGKTKMEKEEGEGEARVGCCLYGRTTHFRLELFPNQEEAKEGDDGLLPLPTNSKEQKIRSM
jgi:hypothetical protein